MSRRTLIGFALVVLGLVGGCAQVKSPNKWEPAIEKFEQQDRTTPAPQHPILFVGSSTIRIWKVKDAFGDLPVLNRGFGGSQVEDVLTFFDRVVARYQPSEIVFYSGDNDLAAGKSSERVVADIQQFIRLVRQKLPRTKLIVIAIKPSISRWRLIDQMRQTNQQVRKLIEARSGDVFIDVEPQILDENGKPRPDLFRPDGLHLNDKGYVILNEAVRPYLEAK